MHHDHGGKLPLDAILFTMSSEDDELLTEEGEDDYEPTPGKKEFTIYRPLDPPITKQWSIEDLHCALTKTSIIFTRPNGCLLALMHQGLIDLEAPYQRGLIFYSFMISAMHLVSIRGGMARQQKNWVDRLHFPKLLYPTRYICDT